MLVSFVFPVFNEQSRIEASLQDFFTFFKRFPINFELILVAEPCTDQTLDLVKQHKNRNEILLIENQKRLGRGPSVLKGLDSAKGDVIFVGSIDLNVPLAEYFNTLQDFVLNKSTEFVIGNRKDKKKLRHGQSAKTKKFFEVVEEDKLKKLTFGISDPTCTFFAIKRETYHLVKSDIKRIPSWFYSSCLLIPLLNHKITVAEKAITWHDSMPSKFKWWKALL